MVRIKRQALKTRLLVFVIAFLMIAAIPLGNYKTYAAETEPAVELAELQVASITLMEGGGVSAHQIKFQDGVTLPGDWTPVDVTKMTMKDKDGNNLLTKVEAYQNTLLVNPVGGAAITPAPKDGDILTLKAGFTAGTTTHDIKEDTGFIFDGDLRVWTQIDLSLEELKIRSVTRNGDTGAWGHMIYFQEGFAFDANCGWQAVDTSLLTLTDKDGANILVKAETALNGVILNASANGDPQPKDGDILTIKVGFNGDHGDAAHYTPTHEIRKQMQYKYNLSSNVWIQQGVEIIREELTAVSMSLMEGGISGHRIKFQDGVSLPGDWTALDTTNMTMVDKDGKNLLTKAETYAGTVLVNAVAGALNPAPKDGDILTLKAGFTAGTATYEIKEDVSFTFNGTYRRWLKEGDEIVLDRADIKSVEWKAGDTAENNGTYVVVNPARGYAIDANKQGKTIDTTYIEMKLNDANVLVNAVTAYPGIAINKGQAKPAEGTVLTFKKGFSVNLTDMTGEEVTLNDLKEEVSYTFTGGKWAIKLDDSLSEMVTPSVIYETALGGNAGLNAIRLSFDTKSPIISESTYWSQLNENYVELTDSRGNDVLEEVIIFTDCGLAINANKRISVVGDILTIKAGFKVVFNDSSIKITAIAQAKSDMKFVLSDKNEWVPYVGAPTTVEFTETAIESPVGVAVQLEWTVGPKDTYGTPLFSSANDAIATVTAKGVVVGVAVGETTITAKLSDGVTATTTVKIVAEKELIGIEFVDYFVQMVPKGGEYTLKFNTVRYVYADEYYGIATKLEASAFTYTKPDTTSVGEKTVAVTVKYNGKDYVINAKVNVYEYFDQVVKDVSIVDWFDYSIFLFFSDTSSNHAHMTEASLTPNMLDYISYERADGTEINIRGYYMLAGGLVPVFVFSDTLTSENYDEYYLAGDILTIEEGMPLYKWNGEYWSDEDGAQHRGIGESVVDGYVKETVQFYFDGNVWMRYIEYTDLAVASESITLEVGKTALTGVTRVPVDATMGTFSYSSSSPTVATVRNGIITGVSLGTATITVTIDGGLAGKITKTVNVTVVDYVTGLVITPGTLDVKKGGNIDLANLSAKLEMASGAEGAAADLTNAVISGFDAQKTGAQTVVITVTINGKEYSGVVTVNVAGGCGSNVQASTSFAGLIILLGAALLALKKKSVAK